MAFHVGGTGVTSPSSNPVLCGAPLVLGTIVLTAQAKLDQEAGFHRRSESPPKSDGRRGYANPPSLAATFTHADAWGKAGKHAVDDYSDLLRELALPAVRVRKHVDRSCFGVAHSAEKSSGRQKPPCATSQSTRNLVK